MNICYCLLSAPQNQCKTERKKECDWLMFFVGPSRDLFSQVKKEKTNICTSKFEILSN